MPCGTASAPIEWRFLGNAREERESARWCAGVGPPVIRTESRTAELPSKILTVVTWNTHVGAGDVAALVDDLVAGRLTGGRPVRAFAILVQEAVRRGSAVPEAPVRAMRGARRIARPSSHDIESVAARLGLSLFYVPSMRNGGPAVDEDRGNAILASVPLDRLAAIELPFERQRRVALEARVSMLSPGGPVSLRIATAHLTNMVGHHFWIFSEPGRARQAEALARALDESPLVLGGDFNTWFGGADAAYRALARRFTPVDRADRRPTFGRLRLDHFFVRLPPGWRFAFHRGDRRYGSDHYPLIGELRFAARDRADSPR
jgi:endonuclease/exonuclease/phosphatase family metal-dependent hydrolase